ncbi:MAG: hypothetical protein WC489_00365 [Patescibacteria group bacterium]
MDPDKDETIPDPLENIKKILSVVLDVLLVFFSKVVPIVSLGFLGILLLLYLFFKLFGLG